MVRSGAERRSEGRPSMCDAAFQRAPPSCLIVLDCLRASRTLLMVFATSSVSRSTRAECFAGPARVREVEGVC